ncbi:MAG: four helix bundle protein [Verrucomicrobiaceae bacterium]|nr:four helix bundle protein [Verrucomicrobiaceae bacterium]
MPTMRTTTPTQNKQQKYDLEERLLDFAVDVIRFVDQMFKTEAGRHVSGQLLRSGTAPMAHHGEAQAAESNKDFVHKMRVAHKELRETVRWLKVSQRVPLTRDLEENKRLLQETDELVRIFFASIRTAQSKQK